MLHRHAYLSFALLIAGCAAATPGGPTQEEIGSPSSRLSTPAPDAGAGAEPSGPAAYVPEPAGTGPTPSASPSPSASPAPASPAPSASPSGLATLPPAPTPSPKPSGLATLPPLFPWSTPSPGGSPQATSTPISPWGSPSPSPGATTSPAATASPRPGNAGSAVGAGVVLENNNSLQFNMDISDKGNMGTMTGFAVLTGLGMRLTCTPNVVLISAGQLKASGAARINSTDGNFTLEVQDGTPDRMTFKLFAGGKNYALTGPLERGDITITVAP